MSNFLRDLAIAKFPRFGIVYYVQCNGEPEIQGKNMAAPLKFYDGKTVPPTHLADRTIKMPLWKWGEMLDVVEEECFAEYPSIVAVELIKRRPDDTYGNLQIQLSKQVQLDANRKDAPSPAAGGGSAAEHNPTSSGAPQEQEGPSKPQAGDMRPLTEIQNEMEGITPAACSHPALDRIVLHDLADVLVYDCGVCWKRVVLLRDRAEVVE